MRLNLFIIPTFLFYVAGAQNNSTSGGSVTPLMNATTPSVVSTTTISPPSTPPTGVLTGSTQTAIMDYKSVYETETVEDEVKMAAERFNLTPAQQDVWLTSATERRRTEKQAYTTLDSKKQIDNKDDVYRGLRSAQTTFYETIIGYLNPAQKQALETDRLINQEKQKRLAKLPPPPPPAPTVTVAPVDSAAIKESEKPKGKGKKTTKKKKSVGA